MLRIMLMFLLFANLAITAFAAQCPPSTVFSHIKGQPWTVNTQTAAQGWAVFLLNDDAINSELTRLEPETEMSVSLSLYWLGRAEANCYYTLKSDSANYIAIVNQFHQVDMNNIPQPPFEGNNPYRCITNSATSEVCAWKWKRD